ESGISSSDHRESVIRLAVIEVSTTPHRGMSADPPVDVAQTDHGLKNTQSDPRLCREERVPSRCNHAGGKRGTRMIRVFPGISSAERRLEFHGDARGYPHSKQSAAAPCRAAQRLGVRMRLCHEIACPPHIDTRLLRNDGYRESDKREKQQNDPANHRRDSPSLSVAAYWRSGPT